MNNIKLQKHFILFSPQWICTSFIMETRIKFASLVVTKKKINCFDKNVGNSIWMPVCDIYFRLAEIFPNADELFVGRRCCRKEILGFHWTSKAYCSSLAHFVNAISRFHLVGLLTVVGRDKSRIFESRSR